MTRYQHIHHIPTTSTHSNTYNRIMALILMRFFHFIGII